MSRNLVARVTSNQGSNPGPGAYDVSGSIGKGPKFTMKSRHESSVRPITAPYRLLPSTVGQGPKISLASRYEVRFHEDVPGPDYIPPALGSDGKKIAMSYRHNEVKDSRSDNPGPGAYAIEPKFAKDAQKFTLKGRIEDKGQESSSPGPGAYLPDFNAVKRRSPSPTMHIRPKEHSQEVSPGPADYPVNRELGGKSSTFHIRPQTSTSYTTPGPGEYEPTNKNLKAAPAFTMKSRHETNSRPISAPYHVLPSTVGDGPKIHLASRHNTESSENYPGPGYIPPALGSNSKKFTMGLRHTEGRDSRTDNPGPGAYNIEPKFAKDALKFSLHGRTGDRSTETVSPGPGAYKPNFDAVKSKPPTSSLHIRPKERTVEQTPGYVDLGTTLTGPKFTIGAREKVPVVPI